jgi:hypothetical protein
MPGLIGPIRRQFDDEPGGGLFDGVPPDQVVGGAGDAVSAIGATLPGGNVFQPAVSGIDAVASIIGGGTSAPGSGGSVPMPGEGGDSRMTAGNVIQLLLLGAVGWLLWREVA